MRCKVNYTDNQVKVMLNMIADKNISNECKVLYIIELLAAGNIGLGKARELITESGLTEKSWLEIDAGNVEEFEKRYKQIESGC